MNFKILDKKKPIIFSMLIIFSFSITIGQNNVSVSDQKVLIIGEDEGEYETLVSSCPDMLLSVAGNSMEEAFNLWNNLLTEMELLAVEKSFDLKGIRMWINVFWNAEGQINRIVYYPKPTSKNMDFELLTDFLNDFADNYTLPMQHTRCFSHYGSASFPLLESQQNAHK